MIYVLNLPAPYFQTYGRWSRRGLVTAVCGLTARATAEVEYSWSRTCHDWIQYSLVETDVVVDHSFLVRQLIDLVESDLKFELLAGQY